MNSLVMALSLPCWALWGAGPEPRCDGAAGRALAPARKHSDPTLHVGILGLLSNVRTVCLSQCFAVLCPRFLWGCHGRVLRGGPSEAGREAESSVAFTRPVLCFACR